MAGFPVEQVKVLLRYENERRCSPPLPHEEVDAIAESLIAADALKAPRRSIQLLSRGELDRLPDPEFLIDGLLVKNSLALLYGDPGAAKTFLALDMAIRVATGSPWFGQEVSPASVVYVCAEGHTGIGRRIRANEYRTSVSATNFWLVPSAIQLHEPSQVADFISVLHEKQLRPGLIVFDTLARCAVGVDENAAMDMGRVVAGMDRIKQEFGATVLTLHHSKKAEGKTIRGSSALAGAIDTALALTVNEDRERILTVQKQKDSEPADSLRFTLQPVYEHDSAVLVLEGKADWQPTLTGSEEKALDALRELGSAGSTKWRTASGLKKTTFNRTRQRLMKAGRVGLGGDEQYRITATGGLLLVA